MKILIIFIFSLFLRFIVKSQNFTPVEGSNITVTIGGDQYKAFTPLGYGTAPSARIFFHVSFSGDGTTISGIEGQRMGNLIKSGGNWNGKIVMPNGDTLYMVILQIPAYGTAPTKYGNAVKVAINSWSRLDQTRVANYSLSGLSGGPGRAISWLQSDTTLIRNNFKRGVFMSPTFIGSPFTWSANGYWWTWYSSADPNGGTPPSAATGLHSNLSGTKQITSINVACHCNTIWDSAMNFTGLLTVNGSNATNNRIRFLVDPTDSYAGGSNANPVAVAGADQTITLPTNSVTVNGSGSFDSDGTISAYAWSKISGPSTFTITSPTSISTTITGLVEGIYTFRLTVTDNNAATGTDDVQITVNAAPGPDGFPVIGALRRRIVNSKELLYFIADTVTNNPLYDYYYVLNAIDSAGKDSAYAAQRNGLVRKIISGWNGKQLLTNGRTAVFTVITQITEIDIKNTMENAIQWSLDSLPNQLFDTATRHRNILTSTGLGAQRQLYYLLNRYNDIFQSGTLKFKDNFLNYTPVDIFDETNLSNTVNWTTMKQPFRSWWWVGGSNGYPYSPAYTNQGYDSARVRNVAPSTKKSSISGQSYSLITADSAYSSFGSGGENNVFRWWAQDAEYGYAGNVINIHRTWAIDWTGVDGLGAIVKWYFDSPFDIKNDINVDGSQDSTDGMVYTKTNIAFQRLKQREVWLNFQKKYVITAIYGRRKNSSTSYNDTIRIFTHGDRINNRAFVNSDLRSRSDYLLRRISIGNATSWEKIWEGTDTTQYVVIQMSKNTYTTPFPQGTDGNYSDFRFYGYEYGTPELTYNVATDSAINIWKQKRRSNLRDHTGFNFSNIYPVIDYKGFGNERGYGKQEYSFTGHYPYNSMANQSGQDSTNFLYHDSVVMAMEPDKRRWSIIDGANTYIRDTQSKVVYAPGHPLYGTSDFRPVDSIQANPADPASYKTIASNMAMRANAYGFNSTQTVKWRTHNGGQPAPGRGIYRHAEIGNEDDLDLHDSAYMNPRYKAALMWAVWNGDMGAMNAGLPGLPEFGVKIADPNMSVALGAFAGWHYQIAGATTILSKIYAQADTLPFNVIAGHIYHFWKKNDPSNLSDVLIGGHGIHPEGLDYVGDVDTMLYDLWRYANRPIDFDLNEYGWDKSMTKRPECVNGCDFNVFTHTLYGLPQNDASLDSSKWQSVLQMRAMGTLAASRVRYSATFTFADDHNPYVGLPIYPYSYCGNKFYHGLGVGPPEGDYNVDSTTYFASYYHMQGWAERFKDWYVDSVIDKTEGGRFCLRWRHKNDTGNADSLYYMLWKGDTLTGGGANFSIPVPSSSTIKEFTPQWNTRTIPTTTLSPSGGTYAANAGLIPEHYVVYLANTVSIIKSYFRGNLRRNKFKNSP